MADLDTLRPEVAQALGFIERNQKYGDGSVCAGDIDIIRAELLRLVRDNDALRSKCNVIMSGSTRHLGRAERAESELAALKARIAKSMIWDSGYFVQTGSGGTELVGGKRYRLLLDDGESA